MAGTFILNFSGYPETLETLKKSSYAIGPMLMSNPRVFIIGVGGGNDVWAAKLYGAKTIKGVELNKQVLNIHQGVLYNFSKNIIDDKRIELHYDEGRSALLRDKSRYDLIQMSGIDTWTALASGAYVLAENYLYTIEAFRTMYDRLAEGGILSITRFAMDMEALRIIATIDEAIKDRASGKLENSVICLFTGQWLMTILVKRGEFSAEEILKINSFAVNGGFTTLYIPGETHGSTLETFIRTKDKDRFIREFPRDISALPDDRPYFFNFTKWNRMFESKKFVTEHPSVSQGNPLFILSQLFLSGFFAMFFIITPLLIFRQRGIDQTHIKSFLVYFSGIGLGFISIEISIMQKLVLFLGNPMYSITVTLFSMLVFTGLGSLISEKWFSKPTARSWLVPVGVAVLLGLLVSFSPKIIENFIVWPTPLRVIFTVCLLAPISFLLGIPFSYGIRLVNKFNPAFIPWAWAVNGCMTVIGSIATVIISMKLGFNFVLIMSILIYFVTFAAVSRLR